MHLLLAIFVLCLLSWANAQSCPPPYNRFTDHHTICIPPNPSCQIKVRGLFNEKRDTNQILITHNTLRSKVATGRETQAGGLPTASNMMQMMWDPELAKIAQKWAENCKFEHDCNACREVENFSVGQNIAYIDYYCPGGNCADEYNGKKPDWKGIIQMFYDEVKNFDYRDVDHFGPSRNGGVIGHFTQVIWANSWRIGCGFTSFQNGDFIRNFFVCNYGPAGNVQGAPIYLRGEPCSKCPLNACCGSNCQGINYGGLCKMLNRNEAPQYPPPSGKMLMYCTFDKNQNDCQYTVNGPGVSTKRTLMGNMLTIVLENGQQTQVSFSKTLFPSSNFCVRITFRKGPAVYGQGDTSKLEAIFLLNGWSTSLTLSMSGNQFAPFGINLPQVPKASFSLKFSVPPGAPKHILDIKKIEAFDGNCNTR